METKSTIVILLIRGAFSFIRVLSSSLGGFGQSMLFVVMVCIIILHGVVINGLIILVLSRLPIIHIVIIIFVLVFIVLSILVDLLLSGLLESFGLLSLEPAEHADDLLDDLEHVADHGGGELPLGVER